MAWPAKFVAFVAFLSIACAGVGWGAEYRAPLPYATMFDQLKVGMDRRQAHEITRAPELEREPADFETTDLLRLELAMRHCRAHLLRLHWYKGSLHWVEHFELDPVGITYQERGNPDPIGEALVRQLTEQLNLYTSRWRELTDLIAAEGSATIQARARQATDDLARRLEELHQATQR